MGGNPGNEIGKKLRIYSDDSGDPVKMFFFVSFFLWQRRAENFIEIVILEQGNNVFGCSWKCSCRFGLWVNITSLVQSAGE